MKPSKLLLLYVLLSLTAICTHFSFAGDRVGNGGGGWVCRDSNHSIRWISLVDLFEAENEYGYRMRTFSGSKAEIVLQILPIISNASPQVQSAIEFQLNRLNMLEPTPSIVHYTNDVLELTDDLAPALRPNADRCPEGKITYEQIVNYKNDGSILVQRELMSALSETSKAALVWHETIYAYIRSEQASPNSRVARRLVGLLFSDMDIAQIKNEIYQIARYKMMLEWPIRMGEGSGVNGYNSGFTAIAINFNTGSYGASWNQESVNTANSDALRRCNGGCQIVSNNVINACVAFSYSPERQGGWTYGSQSRGHTETESVKACEAYYKTTCKLAISVCSSK